MTTVITLPLTGYYLNGIDIEPSERRKKQNELLDICVLATQCGSLEPRHAYQLNVNGLSYKEALMLWHSLGEALDDERFSDEYERLKVLWLLEKSQLLIVLEALDRAFPPDDP